jgi:hypothetical protein
MQVNHRPESRMREIRLYGSEGGGAVRSPYPYLERQDATAQPKPHRYELQRQE